MVVKENGNKYSDYYMWEKMKYLPYNYAKSGILSKILSGEIVKTKNKALQYVLTLYEQSLVFLLKYVDEVKNFKNVHWKNR